MPAFPHVLPTAGQSFRITLSNGSEFDATWDGLQWWVGINDDPNDLPLVNEMVISWRQFD